ncbi:DUF4834 family protein [Christiangramia sabulilitoris]|uniref:DUF4834 family protein n=1 Tax=Christiangramia sabulilitoris TaxID=2583991 RepID=A0A550I5W3_9FLAO|nr:DUF4834 family protein [Christiangramia sabulilitoris]TRO66347.1 DUF4834 family protein [Christiangramia sabulilitoris]
MLEASLSGVLKTVLIVLLVYFGLKIFFRFFGPLILKWFMKKMGQKFEKQFNQQFGGAQRPPEKNGKVTIDKKPKGNKESNKNVGEYIDYEEID